jgi:hypothetical protein
LFQIFKKSISDPIFWEANVGTEQDAALRPAKFVGAFF